MYDQYGLGNVRIKGGYLADRAWKDKELTNRMSARKRQRQASTERHFGKWADAWDLDADTEMASYRENPSAWMRKNQHMWGSTPQSPYHQQLRRGRGQNTSKASPGSGLSEGQRRRYFQSSDAVDDFLNQ
tara:strand:+ start:101 stop:490 length:390 start_codon:yes stop_codon:yes gene_type:complete